ncbi:uncharacterized protein LOC101859396 [Aplysia californica]|uniref:Uncharacterized protein LOC101859396 n=1 Tax=Aplysia californica TaxID=6500 RepID=A0ABM0JKV6_APLCA|nr:uncharacterized protein LOC101859396 [Aplysia californica]
MRGDWRLLALAVLSVYFLTTVCHACKKSRKKEYVNKQCRLRTEVITGFPGGISEHSLKHPVCSNVFSSVFETETTVADWLIVLDQKNRWAICPQGHFLQGFKFTNHEKGVYAVEEGRCTKSNKLHDVYGDCYNQRTSSSSHCRREGYFLAGIYRGDCSGWGCISQLRCCKMTSEISVDSVEVAKDKVMVRSLNGLAQLASFLGYDGTVGCFGDQPGDNFEKDGYSWKAKKCARNNNRQLKISYGDWKIGLSDVKYSNRKTTELEPKTIDSGVLTNPHPTPAVEIITRHDKSIRTVTHSLTSHWKVAVTTGIKVSYSPSDVTGGLGGEFSFSITAEGGEKTTDETQNVQEQSMEVTIEKELDPYTAARWVARMYQIRTTQYYRATLRMECTAQLEGNLKKERNYHRSYVGRSKYGFKYRFGDKDTPFFVAVKKEKEQWSYPWMWGDLIEQQPWVKNVVGYLANQTHYEFVLEGKFEDIQGYKVEMEFGNHTELPRPGVGADYAVPMFGFGENVGKGEDKVVVAAAGPHDPPSDFQPVYD